MGATFAERAFTVSGARLLNAGGTANWLPWSSGDDFIQLVSGTGFYIQSLITNPPLNLLMVSGQATSLGWVGIGTITPNQGGNTGSGIPCKLTVNGAIGTGEIVVTNGITADYVFDPGYRLAPLPEVAAYIQEHHHLPEIPSAAEVKEKGVSLGEMQAKLLAKIEELTLHLIQADERLARADEKNRELQERIARLEAGGRGESK